MRIEFADRQLQRCYEDPSLAARRWGVPVARKFADRVLAIQDATSWAELVDIRTLRAHPLRGERSGQWAMTLQGRWRMIVRPVEGGDGVVEIVIIEEVSNHYGD